MFCPPGEDGTEANENWTTGQDLLNELSCPTLKLVAVWNPARDLVCEANKVDCMRSERVGILIVRMVDITVNLLLLSRISAPYRKIQGAVYRGSCVLV